MALSLFGYTISKDEPANLEVRKNTFIPPDDDEGASAVAGGGYFGTYVDLDATAKSESEVITKYRETSMYSDVSNAIDEIVTEAIAGTDTDRLVDINLDNVSLSDNIKLSIRNEFYSILKMLEFKSKGQDIFRRWYIDGRIYYQKVIDNTNPRKGVLELRYIDPRKIKKVRDIKKKRSPSGIDIIEKIEEFYIYNEKGLRYTQQYGNVPGLNQGIKISPDTITFVPSGVMDLEKSIVLSYLHKAVKPANQLKMMEDSLVIYRISRAPERRIFYIDVGNLPKIKAEQYLKDVMNKYRNKIVYDSNTGEIKDDRKFMSMLEDFWLPRREGGRGTEITTLPGGENLGQIDDINYFKNKLYQSLNVPMSRLEASTGMNFGRAAEITRDELKFGKFVDKLRKKFNELFSDVMRTQLILKGIMTDSDWNEIKEDINFIYSQDRYYSELKDAENLRNRVDVLNQMAPFIGTYFSQEYVMKKVLRYTDDEMIAVKEQIQNEGPPPQPINNAEPQQ
ncbi:MAG: portal protein [Minisyncoccia bacterium]